MENHLPEKKSLPCECRENQRKTNNFKNIFPLILFLFIVENVQWVCAGLSVRGICLECRVRVGRRYVYPKLCLNAFSSASDFASDFVSDCFDFRCFSIFRFVDWKMGRNGNTDHVKPVMSRTRYRLRI